MRFNLFKFLFASIMSLALLSSSSGIGIFMHYCKGELVETALYVKHTCEPQSNQDTPIEGECISVSNCCEDETYLLKTSDFQKEEAKIASLVKFATVAFSLNELSISTIELSKEKSRGPPTQLALYSKTSKFIQESRLLI